MGSTEYTPRDTNCRLPGELTLTSRAALYSNGVMQQSLEMTASEVGSVCVRLVLNDRYFNNYLCFTHADRSIQSCNVREHDLELFAPFDHGVAAND